MSEDFFIPCTKEREIAPNIVFRPRRSWHSATFAGEGLFQVHGDGSGCLHRDAKPYSPLCSPPLTVTHRKYWHKLTDRSISAFLSYPNGMGDCGSYFWEIYPINGDIARFSSETEMEEAIVRELYQGAPTDTDQT